MLSLEDTVREREKKLESNIITLAKCRDAERKKKETVDFWNAELQTYLDAFPNAIELTQSKDELRKYEKATEILDLSVRNRTLDVYDLLGHKNVYEGVTVAEYTTFEIDDKKALTWASKHHRKALKLDVKEIKKVAKAGMEVSGVVIGKENRVKIASDLSGYLSEAEDAS